ncbi:T9SS type A sorting domain-containing protein [Flavobacterium sp.]|uniref:T9SS type A sorting domain-containing protein n=1 Tax=Flavobacterium sp. TaxID=239 RepID=UPI0038FCB66C
MKKTIKTWVSLLLLLGSLHCFSQTETNPNTELSTARLQLIAGSSNYNPEAALATYQLQAIQGNAEAMNGLGLIYSRGLGLAMNEALGLEWFEKAAQNGYAKAYYNMAMLYKKGVSVTKDLAKAATYFEKAATSGYNEAWLCWGEMAKDGQGIPQDYALAMSIFQQGANNGDAHCMYAQGYLYYKGFGVLQDYNKAIEFFQQAADKGNVMGIYMLGYCYRNGYGVTIDAEKAKYWLTKAADLGFNRADLELAQPLAENATPNQTKTVSATIPEVENITAEIPKKYKKVKQKINNNNLSGIYTGHLMRYDWSGQNILSTTPIKVTLDQEDEALTGIWVEQDGDSIAFKATMKKKFIEFDDAKIDRLNRYQEPKLETYQFNEAKLQVLATDDALYLAGNLQLYNIKQHENEKPMYVILEHKINPDENKPDPAATGIVSHLVVYPNPVTTNSFKLSFELVEQTDIKIKIYDFTGFLVAKQQITTTSLGLQEQNIAFDAPTGNYILNLYYGNEVIKTILIKK